MKPLQPAAVANWLAQRRRWLWRPRLFLAVGAAVVLYSLLGFLLLPYAVRHYLPEIVSAQLQRPASVGEIRFNPWTFELEIHDFTVTERDRRPLLLLERLFVDFEASSALAGPWTVADLRLTGLHIELEADAGGRLNVQAIAAELAKPPEPPPAPGKPVRFRLDHASLTDAVVQYRQESAGIIETLRGIDLDMQGLSTEEASSAGCRMEARLASGGTLNLSGAVTLTPLTVRGTLALRELPLATPWRFLRRFFTLAEPGGKAELTGGFRYADGDFSVADADFTIEGLRLALPEEPLLELERAGFRRARFDLARHSLVLPSLAMERGSLQLALDAGGGMNWARLVPAAEPVREPAAAPADPAPRWRLGLEELKLADLAIDFRDASRRLPLALRVGRFGLGLQAAAEFGGAPPQVRVNGLQAELKEIALADPGAAPVALETLTLSGGEFDLAERRVGLDKLELGGGQVRIERLADGSLPLADRFAGPPAAEPVAAPVPQPAWQFRLGKLGLSRLQLSYLDYGFNLPLRYDAEGIELALGEFRSGGSAPVPFDLALALRQGGKLNLAGTAAPGGDRVEARIKAERLDLKPLQSVLARYAALQLTGGDISAALELGYERQPAGAALQAAGKLAVERFQTREVRGGDRFLEWKRMSVDGIDFGLQPNHLTIKEVRFVEPGSKIAIKPDRTINVVTVFQEKIERLPPAKPVRRATKPAPPFPVRIERVKFERGVMNFSDASLVLPFATTIHDFGGTVTDIGTAADSRSRIDFAGRVEEYGSAKVDGVLIPQKILDDSSLQVVFRNVSMDSLSPYSATFAGRKIQSGKLSLDLDYRIQRGMLKSENRITLERFALGERVESPKAVTLPLDLAIALLTDGDGKINASVPVEGDVRKPDFRYGPMVWDAFLTLVTKAVTSPFRALGALFGGADQEDLGSVGFAPGSASLPPPEREKLHKLMAGLAQRPMLKLAVHGGYDRERDGEALRALQLRRVVAQARQEDLGPDQDPGPLSFSNAETQQALEKVAATRGGKPLLQRIEDEFAKGFGRKPKRIGAIRALLGQAGEDQAFYENLYRELVKAETLPEATLTDLAERRGAAVLGELSTQPGFDPGRIARGAAEAVGADQQGKVPVKLDVGS